ncbi:hypothetical protein N7466_002679 [Penicillium verhagenii]|uniref:uncharacterized protein n=1 Tax=Penicillium verhagenii TaxID=1562060 RepID=UPI0025458E41|nr:uncharacterized protein N7466_002679 [Penicillium verhagenii]KAJ5939545.1 hypothetical protein N7466_002679 [Penicillium verhagenii]
MSSPFNLILTSQTTTMDFIRLLKQWATGPPQSRQADPDVVHPTRTRKPGTPMKVLDIVLLDEILEFNRFKGIMYNPYNINHPDLLFAVSLPDGTEEVIRCGEWVHGNPVCVNSLVKLKLKICHAKELVPWDWMWDTRQIQSDQVLQLQWPSAANYHE